MNKNEYILEYLKLAFNNSNNQELKDKIGNINNVNELKLLIIEPAFINSIVEGLLKNGKVLRDRGNSKEYIDTIMGSVYKDTISEYLFRNITRRLIHEQAVAIYQEKLVEFTKKIIDSLN